MTTKFNARHGLSVGSPAVDIIDSTGGITVSGTITATTFVGAFSGTVSGTASLATNIAGGTTGQLNYQTAANLTGFVGPGTYGQFLMSTGAAAPVYQSTLTQSNGNIVISGTTVATSTVTGALQVAGGIGVGRALYIGSGTNVVETNNWEKWRLITTGVTAPARQGSDGNGLNFTSNALWTGSVWQEDDTSKKKFAYIQHLGNSRHEFRTAATGSGITWVTGLTVDDTAATFSVPVTAGSITVTGSSTFSGPVTFSNTATYINSTNTIYTDNIIELHSPNAGVYTPWFVDDGKDIGFRFHYYTASTDTNAALVLANDTKYLEWYASGAESTTGTFAGGTYGTFKTGNVYVTNNVGIGTTAPSYKLQIADTANTYNASLARVGSVGTGLIFGTNATPGVANNLISTAGSGDYITINAGAGTGNLLLQPNGGSVGVSVTPSSWGAGYGVIDLNTGGAIYGTSNGVSLSSNLYFNGTNWKAKTTGLGTLMASYAGQFIFYNSASVTTGTNASLVETVRMDASGNLGIGVSPTYRLDVNKASTGTVARLTGSTDGGRGLSFSSADNGVYLGAIWTRDVASAYGIHAWSINSAEKMRLDTTGYLGIGTTTPVVQLHVANSNNTSIRINATAANGSAELDMLSNGTQHAFIDFGPNDLQFRSTNADMSAINNGAILRITNSGNVGVGYTASQLGEKLGVNGGAYVNGALTATTVVSTVNRGTSYAVTSSTSIMGYIDTGLGVANFGYGAVYQVYVQANPNPNGSGSYTDNLYGKVIIGTGYSGAAVTTYIYFVQENIPRPYNSGGTEPTIDAVFNISGSEATSFTTGSGSPQIRIKVGYPSGQGVAGQICYITKVS